MRRVTELIGSIFHIYKNIIDKLCCFFCLFGIIFILPDEIIGRLRMTGFLNNYGKILGPIWWIATVVLGVGLINDFRMRYSKIKDEKLIIQKLRSLNDKDAAFVYKLYSDFPYHSIWGFESDKKGTVTAMEAYGIFIRSDEESCILNPLVVRILERESLLKHYLEVQYNNYNRNR